MLFMRCWNLPAGHCVAGVQAVYVVFESTCQALCCRSAGCLSCFGTYLPGLVLQSFRLFKQSQNPPAGYCVQGCRLFNWCRNLPARTVLQGWRLFKRCQNLTAGCLDRVKTYLTGTVLQGCRLFIRCQNLSA